MSLQRAIAMFGGTAALALLACSAFSSSDDPGPAGAESGAPDSPDDGQPRDAATTDAPNADAAVKNLLLNGNFEAAAGCGGWTSNNANFFEEKTVPPHGGTKSCLVCGLTPDVYFDISQVVTPFVPGETYLGDAFVRAPAAGADAAAATVIRDGFIVQNAAGSVNLDTQFSGGPALSAAEWRPIGAIIRADVDGGARLIFLVQGANGCFLLDDARVYQQR